jgi:hypothetical protein
MDPNWVMRQAAMVAFDSVEYIEMSRTQEANAGPRKVSSPVPLPHTKPKGLCNGTTTVAVISTTAMYIPLKGQRSSTTATRKDSAHTTHTQTHKPRLFCCCRSTCTPPLPSSGILNEHRNNDRTSIAPCLPTIGTGEHIIIHKTRKFLQTNYRQTSHCSPNMHYSLLVCAISPRRLTNLYQPACRAPSCSDASAAFNAASGVRIVVGSPHTRRRPYRYAQVSRIARCLAKARFTASFAASVLGGEFRNLSTTWLLLTYINNYKKSEPQPTGQDQPLLFRLNRKLA